MNTLEHDFWDKVKSHIPGFIQRIESTTGNGIPDVYVCWKGKPFWIELKVWTTDVGILLRKEQWAWANLHLANGGNSFVLVHMIESRVVCLFHIADIVVEPYGVSEKYVLIKGGNSDKDILTFSLIKESLRKKLFT